MRPFCMQGLAALSHTALRGGRVTNIHRADLLHVWLEVNVKGERENAR
jgi:hypothetical protein